MYTQELKINCINIAPIKLSVSKSDSDISFREELIRQTDFLSFYKKVPLALRYFCVLNDITAIPTCLSCNNLVNFKVDNPKLGFGQFCGSKCSRSNKTIDKNSLALLSNKDWLYNERVILKKPKLQIAKELGCSTVPVNKWLELLEIEHKHFTKNKKEIIPSKELLKKLYFDDNLTLLDIGKKFNVSNVTVRKWFVDLDIQTLLHSETIKRKVMPKTKRTNIQRYGVQYSSQKHFSADVLSKLNDETWLYEQHITNQRSLTCISKELGISDCTLKKYFIENDIETKLFQFSSGEKELADFVASMVPINRSDRKVIKPKELDIYIPSLNVAIEYNGIFWHSSFSGKSIFHQHEKYKLCKKLGIRLITIYDDEWNINKDLVKKKLKSILNCSDDKRIYARNCIPIIINNLDRNNFLSENHIQGRCGGSVNLGLVCDGELVAVMVFKNIKGEVFELTRFATKYSVVGAFSKLLSYFKKNYSWEKIITFSDLRWHDGGVYQKNGFIAEKLINPDYQYVIRGKRFHKANFRLNRIEKNFPDLYDPTLTEFENMNNIGIPRIYDCGKIRFVAVNG